MNVLYVVSHRRSIENWRTGFTETKHIGTFRTVAAAEAAIEQLTPQPGFRDHPSGFSIRRVVLDEDAT